MKYIKKKLSNFYKVIIYNLFKIIYGKITSTEKATIENNILIKEINIENNKYKLYLCYNCRLYTDTIHDTAIIKNQKLIEGPSFQYRKLSPQDPGLANAECIYNSVLKNGTPRIKKIIHGSVFSLLTGGGGNFNYWHWLFDVLPRLYLLKKSNIAIESIDYFLFPNLSKKFQIETLDLMNIPKSKRLSSRKNRHFFSNKIIVTSHPYNVLNDPKIDSLKIPLWICDFLKSQFLENALKSSKIKNFPNKIYINRKDANSLRYIINSKEVENLLKEKSFSSITLSNYSFIDQIALFYNAKEIIGLHGAGFANFIFCKPETRIIEIKPVTAGDMYKNLALQNLLRYSDITITPETIRNNNQAGDLKVNLNDLVNKLLN